MTNYRGYDVSRSLDGSYWFAIPSQDITTERKIKAATPALLKQQINDLVDANPDPWELPWASQSCVAA
jgi:hypothetical protein